MRGSLRLLATLLGAPLVLSGCSVIRGGGADDPSTVVVALFDISRSTSAPAVRRHYLVEFAKVVDAMEHQGGLLVADIIDPNSAADSALPIQETFTRYNPALDNPLKHKSEAAAQMRRVMAKAREILSPTAPTSGTDLLGGLSVAARVFATYPGAEERDLVIFSDMVQVSPSYDFSGKRLTEARIEAIIQAERADGALPHLQGAQVYAVGAGASAQGAQRIEKMRAIESFWLAYFNATGADLPPVRYGAALVKFP